MKAFLLALFLTCAVQARERIPYREIVLEYVLPEDPLLDELDEWHITYWFDRHGKFHILIPDFELPQPEAH